MYSMILALGLGDPAAIAANPPGLVVADARGGCTGRAARLTVPRARSGCTGGAVVLTAPPAPPPVVVREVPPPPPVVREVPPPPPVVVKRTEVTTTTEYPQPAPAAAPCPPVVLVAAERARVDVYRFAPLATRRANRADRGACPGRAAAY